MTADGRAPVEIRMLGPFRVRRADGVWVEPSAWRTRKSMALLQILAMQTGPRLSTSTLIECLWPGSDAEHGKTSLRTAASQIRKVLLRDCLARSHGGLALTDVWVDTWRFKALVEQCRQARADGRHVDAVTAAHQAQALYVRDPDLPVEAEEALTLERDALRRMRSDLLVDAASSALALRWTGEAAQFAEQAISVDPYSERTCRIAMRSFHASGEIERALTVFHDCKTRLVEEFGVDPSESTQNVYVELLRSEPRVESKLEFVGLDHETAGLAAHVSRLASGGGGCVVISGPPRSGTSRWAAQMAGRLAAAVQTVAATDAPRGLADLTDLDAGVTMVDGVEAWSRGTLRSAATTLRQAKSPSLRVLLGIHRTGVDDIADAELDAMVDDGLVQRYTIPPLSTEDLLTLTQSLISCSPKPGLLEALGRVTGSRPGLVVDTIRSWLDEGRLAVSRDELDFQSDIPDHGGSLRGRHHFADLHDMLSGQDLSILEVLAMTQHGIALPGILTLLDHDVSTTAAHSASTTAANPDLRAQFEDLVAKLDELVVLAIDPAGRYALQRRMRDEIWTWTRPATRRQLHRLAAERLSLTVSERVDHWIEAGENGLACAAAMVGAVDAMHECDFAAARQGLLQVKELIDVDTASPEDRLDLAHRLMVCSQHLGYADEAAAGRTEIEDIARTHGLIAPPLEPAGPGLRSGQGDPGDRPPLLQRLGLTASTAPTAEVEALLRDTILRTDPRRNVEDAVEARLLLVGLVLAPRRNFGESRQVLRDVAELGTEAHAALTLVTQHEVGVLLGDHPVDVSGLSLDRHESSPLAITSGLSSAMLNAWMHHDHADRNADKLVDEAIHDAVSRGLPGPWPWVAARMLLQRGDLDRARSISHLAPWRVGGPTAQTLALLGKAELATAQGDRDVAAAALLRGAEIAQRTGATLMLPEVAARMAILGEDEHEDALEYLDLAEVALGEATFGRERVILMLARAAVRALVGRTLSAAVLAGGAATLAASLGLKHAALEASDRRMAYLSAAGTLDVPLAEHGGAAELVRLQQDRVVLAPDPEVSHRPQLDHPSHHV